MAFTCWLWCLCSCKGQFAHLLLCPLFSWYIACAELDQAFALRGDGNGLYITQMPEVRAFDCTKTPQGLAYCGDAYYPDV